MPEYPGDMRSGPDSSGQSRLKVGLLMSPRSIAEWEKAMLTEIVDSDYADIVVWIEARKARPNNVPPYLESKLAGMLAHWEASIPIAHDACERAIDFNLLTNVKRISLPAYDNAGGSECVAGAIDELQQFEPDIIIALDDDDALMQFAALGKYGLWYHAHGTAAAVSGSPGETAGLREVLDRRPFLQTSLKLRGDSVPGRQRTGSTYSNVNPASYRRTRSEHFWKVSSLIPRLMKSIYIFGDQPLFDRLQSDAGANVDARPSQGRLSNIRLIFATIKYVLWKILRVFPRRLTSQRWILMINSGDDPYDIEKYSKIHPREGWFWADPCLIREDGQHFVFFEEASLESGKGHISVMKLNHDGSHSSPTRILEKRYHLSYPFVFRWQDSLYMIPESAENRTIDLYRCRKFPDDWIFERNLMNGVSAYDATLFEHDSTWWLFANIREREGASDWDELSLFYTDNPIVGRWHPHPMNPIVSDIRSARPAGRIFRTDGRIIRPSQDSSYRYGYRIKFNEIVELSKTRYRERVYRCIEPGMSWSIRGTHTFSSCDGIEVIDAVYRIPNPVAWLGRHRT